MESFLADLLPALERQGVSNSVLAHDHHQPARLWPPVQSDAAPYANIYRAPCYGRLLYAPISPHFPFWLHGVLRQTRPELLHLHLPNTSAFWLLLSPAARRIPWVIHWHSDVVASNWDRRLALAYGVYRPFEQALLRRANAVIATSPPYLDSSAALKPWRDKTRVIPLGLDFQRLPAPDTAALERAQALWGDTRLRILNIGRLTYYKGQNLLLEAMRDLPDCRALLVGKGELENKLQAQIQRDELQQRASLLGYQSDAELAALLATCDVFCLPSLERTEAFGVVLMEALHQGKACVVSAIPGSGVGWVVADGHSGLHVPVGDVAALRRALARLRDDESLRARLSATARQEAQARFDINEVAAATAALYRDCLL